MMLKTLHDTKITTILTDLGGVLLDVNFKKCLTYFSDKTGLTFFTVYRKLFLSGLKNDHDSGKISSFEFYKSSIMNEGIDFEEFKMAWSNIFMEKKTVIDYLTALKNDFQLCLASNTDPVHFDYFQKTYSWIELFNPNGLSFTLKSIKPSLTFFKRLCSLLEVGFEECLFIDDLKDNIKAASTLGIRSIQFKGIKQLKGQMEEVL